MDEVNKIKHLAVIMEMGAGQRSVLYQRLRGIEEERRRL